jgi:hypothetical protein
MKQAPTARSEIDMKRPNPELIDQENPEWTEEDFARAVPFSGLPAELRNLLSSSKQEKKIPSPIQHAST